MRRVIVASLIVCLGICAQQKKILVVDDSTLAQELQEATPTARIIPVSEDGVIIQAADADALIGEITSAQVRAAKKLQRVGIMSAGVEGVLYPPERESRFTEQ